MYLDELMTAVDEDNILLCWTEIVDTLDFPPELLAFHKLKIYDKDWLATMKTDQWKTKIRENGCVNISYRKTILISSFTDNQN